MINFFSPKSFYLQSLNFYDNSYAAVLIKNIFLGACSIYVA